MDVKVTIEPFSENRLFCTYVGAAVTGLSLLFFIMMMIGIARFDKPSDTIYVFWGAISSIVTMCSGLYTISELLAHHRDECIKNIRIMKVESESNKTQG